MLRASAVRARRMSLLVAVLGTATALTAPSLASAAITAEVQPAHIFEGNRGYRDAYVPVKATCAPTNPLVAFCDYTIFPIGGTAQNPEDMATGFQKGSLAPGESKTVGLNIRVWGDRTPEPNETVIVKALGEGRVGSDVVERGPQTTNVFTILNDDWSQRVDINKPCRSVLPCPQP